MKIITFNKNFQQEIVDVLHDVLNTEWGSYIDKKKDPDLFNIKGYYLNSGGNFWIGLGEDNSIVGTIAIKMFDLNSKKIGYLKRFYLKKNYRGSGLGKKLIETVIKFCKKKGIGEIVLGTNPESKRAIRFFKKAGFYNFEMYNSLPTFGDKIFMKKIFKKKAGAHKETPAKLPM